MNQKPALVVAVLATAGWVLLAWGYPLLELAPVRHIDLGKLTAHSWNGWLTLLAFLAGQWLAFLVTARAWPAATRTSRIVLGALAGVSLVAAVLTYPVTAADVFDYVGHGWIMLREGYNPFVTRADFFPLEGVLRLMAWTDTPAVYGPVWVLPASLVALGEVEPGIRVLGVTVLVVLALPVMAWAAWRIGGRGSLPAYLVLANPLVLWEAGVNGHNDAWMGALVGVAVALALGGRWALAGGSLALSAGVKFLSAGVALPLLVASLRGPRPALVRLVAGGLAGLAGVLLLYAPFWADGRVVTVLLERGGLSTTSLPGIVTWLLPAAQAGAVNRVVGAVLVVLFALAVIWITWRQWRGRLDLVDAAGWILLATLALVTWWYQPWYLLWLLPLAVARPGTLQVVFWLAAVGGMATYLGFQYWPIWRDLGIGFAWVQLAGWLLAWGPAAVGLAVCLLRGRRQQSRTSDHKGWTGEAEPVNILGS